MEEIIWRRASRLPTGLRSTMTAPIRHAMHPAMHPRLVRNASSSPPSIMQPSFWKSLIPKPFRRKEQTVNWGPSSKKQKAKSKEWNPATFYIVIFLFIGSMSIQMIALKQEFNTFMRRSETRIGLLQEVVEKLQRGEEVDVEKELGTGDATKEQEWEAVLRQIEREDSLRNSKKTMEKGGQTDSTTNAERQPDSKPEETQDTKSSTAKPVGYSSFF